MNLSPISGKEEGVIDDKGRLSVKKATRDALVTSGSGQDTFCLMVDHRGVVVAMHVATRDIMWREVQEADPFNDACSEYSAMLFEYHYDDRKFDKEGRMIVPQELREREGFKLKGPVVLKGAGTRLEFWPPDELKKYEADPLNYGKERRERMKALRAAMREGA